jgi:hypothetical protein
MKAASLSTNKSDCNAQNEARIQLSVVYFLQGGQVAAGIGSSAKNISSVSLASTIHPRDPTGPRWWLRGSMSKKISDDIIRLLKDMTVGKVRLLSYNL